MEAKERKNARYDSVWWLAHFPTLRKDISPLYTKGVISLSRNVQDLQETGTFDTTRESRNAAFCYAKPAL